MRLARSDVEESEIKQEPGFALMRHCLIPGAGLQTGDDTICFKPERYYLSRVCTGSVGLLS